MAVKQNYCIIIIIRLDLAMIAKARVVIKGKNSTENDSKVGGIRTERNADGQRGACSNTARARSDSSMQSKLIIMLIRIMMMLMIIINL